MHENSQKGAVSVILLCMLMLVMLLPLQERPSIRLAEVTPRDGVAWKAGGIKRKDKICLLGYARNSRNAKPWEECRLVKGEMQKVGEQYVWLGWAP